jgi:RNA polymerase sigma-70 factor (ECF subfamily)
LIEAAGIPFSVALLEYSLSIAAISRPGAVSGSDCASRPVADPHSVIAHKILSQVDKFRGWRRLKSKDREEVMENVATDQDWKACFSQWAPGLVLFARQWVRSTADAEDVVQDAFVRFWRRNHPIDNRALLYSAVRSAALDLIRRDQRRSRREIEVFADAERSVEPQFEMADDSQRELAAAVDRLPRDQREVLVMKIWNELTFVEIGGSLGISQNTAASRYRYALAALKKTLQPQ